MKELPPAKSDPYGGACDDVADTPGSESSNMEQIRKALDATGVNLEQDAQLEEQAPTTDWDTLAFTEANLGLSEEQKEQYVEEFKRLNERGRDKEPVEQLQACLHRGTTVDMDRLVATLVQIKMKAKALENVITRQYLEAVHVGNTIAEQQQATADIHSAHDQCQEALLAALTSSSTEKIPIDLQDI